MATTRQRWRADGDGTRTRTATRTRTGTGRGQGREVGSSSGYPGASRLAGQELLERGRGVVGLAADLAGEADVVKDVALGQEREVGAGLLGQAQQRSVGVHRDRAPDRLARGDVLAIAIQRGAQAVVAERQPLLVAAPIGGALVDADRLAVAVLGLAQAAERPSAARRRWRRPTPRSRRARSAGRSWPAPHDSGRGASARGPGETSMSPSGRAGAPAAPRARAWPPRRPGARAAIAPRRARTASRSRTATAPALRAAAPRTGRAVRRKRRAPAVAGRRHRLGEQVARLLHQALELIALGVGDVLPHRRLGTRARRGRGGHHRADNQLSHAHAPIVGRSTSQISLSSARVARMREIVVEREAG